MTGLSLILPPNQAEETLESAFPAIDPGIVPVGDRVIVQLRVAKSKTKGGIILTNDSRDAEKWNTQIGKVISMGTLAYKNRDTMEPWPEGQWCKVGDFVRTAKYGGDRWAVPLDNGDEVLFVTFKDTDIIGLVTSDPLNFKAVY